MSVPGMGILAALRGKKTQSGDTPATPDSSKFAARSAAVLAVEQAVAGGGTPELQRKQTAKGIHIDATGGDYTFDLDAVHEGENQPEIKCRPVTRVASDYIEANLRQIAVSDEFITYGLKQGHIRVLHRFSEARALLKGHTAPIADICFVGRDIVAAGGQNGELFIWRLRIVDGENAAHAEQLLHAKFSPGCDSSPVMLAAASQAGQADAPTRLAVAVANVVLLLDVPLEGCPDLEVDPLSPAPARKMPNFPLQDTPTALAVSSDGRHLAVGSKHGRVYTCRVADGEMTAAATIDGPKAPISSVGWVSSKGEECCLCVGSKNGTVQTLYTSTNGAAAFTRGQSVSLTASTGAESYIHAHVVPEQHVVVLADTPRKAMYTLHYSPVEDGPSVSFDYLARFKVGMPVLNFTAMWDPDLEDEGAVELSCIQTEAVQQYLLDPELLFAEAGAETVTPAPPAPVHLPAPKSSEELPMPSLGMANGADGNAAPPPAAEAPEAEAEEGGNTPPPREPSPPPAVTLPAPPPPVVVPPPVEVPPPAPAAPGGTPRLLTPTDILRSTPERAKQAGPPAAPPKVLQREDSAAGAESAASSTLPDMPSPVPVASPAGAASRPDVAAAVAEEMAGVHRKFAGHVSAMYKELLKVMKSEMEAQQANTAALLREALAAQAAAVQAERAAVLAAERASMERLLTAISTSLNKELPTRLQEAVRGELVTLSSTMAASLAPAVQSAVQSALPKETSAAVKAALDKQLAGSLQSAVTKPIQDAFRHSFTKQIVPSFENACQSMFMQIDKAFTKGLNEHLAEPAKLATNLRDSLTIAESIQRGDSFTRGLSSGAATSAASPRPPVDERTELRALISAGRYEEAFSKALTLQDVGIVSWLCTQVDAAAVLSTTPPALSQMVVLSLIQQLSADLHTAVSTKLQWIREAAMVLNPRDPVLVSVNFKPVLEQVYSGLQATVPRLQGAEASSCKLAMHVVHSQMTS